MNIAKELFNHEQSSARHLNYRDGFVIIEDMKIGVSDTCSNRYYSDDILHAVHAFATGAKLPERTEQILITHLESA